jgi:hypothetical protein
VPPVSAAAAPTDLSFSPAPVPAAMGYAADTNVPAAEPDTSPAPLARTDTTGGMFHSLFQTGERREAVAPAISELWGAQGRVNMPATLASPAGASRDKSAGEGFMLGLFRDPSGNPRAR